MRLDYHDKNSGRESVDRKPVLKNRPRKQPAGLFLLLSVIVLLSTFGAGVLTGWLMYKGAHKAPLTAVAPPAKKEELAPAPGKPGPTTPDAPLTFYKTLPAGGKGVIGSGLNLKKGEPPVSTHRPAPAPPAAAAAASEEKQEAPMRFVVQVASYRDQQDADKAQARLVGKGIAAYVTESKQADNVVWYRIRVGRHLSKAEAEELAVKAGKGAMVLPE